MRASIFIRPTYLGQLPSRRMASPKFFDREAGLASYDRIVEFMELAEDLGFDWITTAEHHYSGNMMSPNPMIFAAYLANRIKRARLSILGPIMPMLNPVRLAEELAMIDNLTGGRLTVGFVRGTPGEFQTYGVNPSETSQRLLEGIELVLKAWSEPEPFGWVGRYFQYRQVSTWPQPFQDPHPPVYVLSSNPESIKFAVERHLGIGFPHDRFESFEKAARDYLGECDAAGWQPDAEKILYRGTFVVSEKQADADRFLDLLRSRGHSNVLDEAPRTIEQRLRAEVDRLDPETMQRIPTVHDLDARPIVSFVGTPDDLIAQVQRCHDMLGVGVIDFIPVGPTIESREASVRLFAREVLPAVQEI